MDDLVSITTTANDTEWLARFLRDLVNARLIACANMIPSVRSIYSWQGAVEDEEECLAVMHTRAGRVAEVEIQVKKSHPYNEPQFLVYPIANVSPTYAEWVSNSTSAESP